MFVQYMNIKKYDEIQQEDFKEERVKVLKELALFIQIGYKTGLLEKGNLIIKSSLKENIIHKNGTKEEKIKYRYDKIWGIYAVGWSGVGTSFKLDPVTKWGKKSIEFNGKYERVEKVWYNGVLLFDNGIERYWDIETNKQLQIPFHYKSRTIHLKGELKKLQENIK